MKKTILVCFLYLLMGKNMMASESIYPKTQVGKIEVKRIPERKGLIAEGQGHPFKSRNESFRKLFHYIQHNDVAMTVPVEASVRTNTMSFFVGRKDSDKNLESDKNIQVRKLQPITVLSIGMRGAYTQNHYEEGYRKIQEWLAENSEWQSEGESYAVYWSSPMVPWFLKRSEVHQPIRSATDTTDQDAPPPLQKPGAVEQEISAPDSIYEFTMKDIDGQDVKLETYRDRVLLIVNVASRCGFTSQYAGLEKIYKRYQDQGLVILGFPANNFLGQEPGTDQEIKSFCRLKYDVTFPMFSKISVKGKDQHPLYRYLTDKSTNPDFAGKISWNFNKFLVNRQGRSIHRFGSSTPPEDQKIILAIEQALKE